jgi:hypothetical protein
MHEMPEVSVVVEILHFKLKDVGCFHGVAGFECALDYTPGLEVTHANAVERLAFANSPLAPQRNPDDIKVNDSANTAFESVFVGIVDARPAPEFEFVLTETLQPFQARS